MRQQYWPILLFISALAVRLLGIGTEWLWYDEAYTAQSVALPLPRMIQATAGDVHPPLYYVITWLITHVLGRSEAVLRLPAALFSAASVIEMYLTVRKVADHRAALWAAGIGIVAGGMQYYGQEARQYSLMTWLTFVSLRSVLEDRHWRFMPALALSMYTHNLSAIYALPLALLALWKWRKQALLPLALAGISYLPWLGVLIGQISDIGSGYWIAPSGMGGMLVYWLYGTFGVRMPEWSQLHIIITTMVISIASLYALRRHLRQYAPLLIMALLPPLELFAVSQVWQPMMLPRALLPSSAGMIGLWGLGLSRMTKQARTAALIILLPMLGLTLVNYFADPTVRRSPADDQVSIYTEHWQQGDVIYHTNVGTAIGYGYYLPQYEYAIMPGDDDLKGGLSQRTKDALGLSEHEIAIAALTARGYKRAFVIWGSSPNMSDQMLDRATQIMGDYPVLETWPISDTPYGAMTIYLIDLRGSYGMVQ